MQHRKDNESRLFADLTRLLMEHKHLSHEQIDAEIERRFRDFVKTPAGKGRRTLHITTTWTLPEGADSWPIYETRYRVDPPARRAEKSGGTRQTAKALADAGATGAVIAFPPQPALAGRSTSQRKPTPASGLKGR